MDLTKTIRELYSPGSDRKAVVAADYRANEPAIFPGQNHSRLGVRGAYAHLSSFAGDNAIDWVFDCANLIGETAAHADYHFEREGEALVPELLPEHDSDTQEAPSDLSKLFSQPNPWATWSDFFYLLLIDYLIVGNAFWLKHRVDDQGRPLALYRLMPQYLSVVPGKTRLIDGFEYRVPGKQPVVFPPEQVAHFKRPNPHSEYLGAGIIAGAPRMYDIELAMTESQAAYYEQGTRLSGVVESERTIQKSTLDKIIREFSSLYSGARNSWQIATLERGLKFKAIQANAAEAEFRHLGPISRDRILAMFRVPGPLLGLTGGFDRQAVKESQRIFDNKTMRPLLDSLQAAITASIAEAWGLDFKIDYEYTMPVEDQLELAADVATIPGMRVREVREAAGYDPLGDERDDIVLNLPMENETGDNPDMPVANSGEGGRPPAREKTSAFPSAGAELPQGAEARRKALDAASLEIRQTIKSARKKLREVENAKAPA
jgi:HK97 family phage portal protein